MIKKILIVILFIILLLAALFGFAFFRNKNTPPIKEISSFEECLGAGFPIQESYPRRCMANGESYTENLGNILEKADQILITKPLPNETLSTSFTVEGQVRGNWFFEGSFPVRLLDRYGNEVARGKAEALKNWMTDEFVPYSASISLQSGYSGPAILILEKDNPSGLPENNDSLEIPVSVSP